MRVAKIASEILTRENGPNLECAKVLSSTDSAARSFYRCVKASAMDQVAPAGLPVAFNQAEDNVLLAPPAHALAVGYTGSGKDQTLGWNVIDFWTRFPAHPNLVVFDYKGEMGRQFLRELEARGYDVCVFNTKTPRRSKPYNPFLMIYDRFHEARSLEARLADEAGFGCEFNGVVYESEEMARSYAEDRVRECDDLVENKISRFATGVILDDPRNQNWVIGERCLVQAGIYMMLHDSLDPETTGMTRERFSLQSLSGISSDFMVDSELCVKWMERGRHMLSVKAAIGLLNGQAKITRDSYLSGVVMNMAQYASHSVARLTMTEGSLDVRELSHSDKPVALFVTCDDDLEVANQICMTLLDDLISELKRVAEDERDGTLDNDWLFLLNEFGNMPRMNNFSKKITTLRSYRIWMFMEVQSYEQLSAVYGEKDAETIIGNCDYTYYLGSASHETNKKFVRSMGKRTANETTASISRGEMHLSMRTTEVPTVRLSEIDELELGEFYLLTSQKYLRMRSYMTPYFQRTDVTLHREPAMCDLMLKPPTDHYDVEEVLKRLEEKEDDCRDEADKDVKTSFSSLFESFDSWKRRPRNEIRKTPGFFDDDDDDDDPFRIGDDDDNGDGNGDADDTDGTPVDCGQSPERLRNALAITCAERNAREAEERRRLKDDAEEIIRGVIRAKPLISKAKCIETLRDMLSHLEETVITESVLERFRLALRKVEKMHNSDFITFRIRMRRL